MSAFIVPLPLPRAPQLSSIIHAAPYATETPPSTKPNPPKLSKLTAQTIPRRPARRPRHPADTAYTDYFNELSAHPPLSRPQERALLSKIAFLRVDAHLRATLPAPVTTATCAAHLNLTSSQYLTRIHRAQKARNHLVTSNLRLVVKIANHHHRKSVLRTTKTSSTDHSGISLTDLIQEGSIALIRAAELFDPAKSPAFSPYAFRAIWTRCARLAQPAFCIVPIPHRLRVAERKLAAVRKVQQRPSEHAMQTAVQPESLARVRDVETHLKGAVFLDRPVRADHVVTVLDLLPSGRLPPEEVVQQELVRRNVKRACRRHLSPRDADVLSMRFGLDDGKPVLAKEIAKRMGVSAPRITQIVLQALETLRREVPELAVHIHEL